MKGITTIIPEPQNSAVKNIWDEIEKKFGLTGVKTTPIPHFTWHLAHDYDLKAVKQALAKLSKEAEPIKITTGGLGFFNNEMFVAYSKVNKSRALGALHKKLCQLIMDFSEEPLTYYLPDQWTPHITLLFESKALIVEQDKLTEYLKGLELKWQFAVDNLIVIQQSETQSPKVLYKASLKK